MASTSSNMNMLEGQSMNRPLFFDGNNYNYWKCRMIIYLKSINYELWDNVINGFDENKKSYREWNEKENSIT